MSHDFEPGRKTELQGRIESLITTLEQSTLSQTRKDNLKNGLSSFFEYTKWPKPGDNLDEMFKVYEDSVYQAIDDSRREQDSKNPDKRPFWRKFFG